jgi:endonuclease/exonuclease/phosphatase family metal-dependent hydrolase
VRIRVLTWNLFHGRSVPPAGRPLAEEFAARLAAWEWDVALLQEVPPWWPPQLAREAGAVACAARTSRNGLLPLRRAVASRRPDLIKSGGGGANAVLSRVGAVSCRSVTLRRLPERRVAQLVEVGDGLCVANYHASTRPSRARDELVRFHRLAAEWAGERPLILGGDLNLRFPEVPMALAARGTVDFIFATGLEAVAPARSPDRTLRDGGQAMKLSDHRALLVELA